MTEISFSVPGIPIPRNSQKVAVTNGHVHQYVPAHVTDYKSRVAVFAKQAMQKAKATPLAGCLAADVVFIFPAPMSSLKKQERSRIEAGELLIYEKISKDLDNLMKAVGDSLQGIVFNNDKQIVDAGLSKRIGLTPGTIITIRTIP